MSQPNLALAYLENAGKDLRAYDGFCLELVDDILHWLDRREESASILHLEPIGGRWLKWRSGLAWTYHAVLLCHGKVHDAWHPQVLTLRSYLARWLKGRAVGVDIFGGGAHRRMVWKNDSLTEG